MKVLFVLYACAIFPLFACSMRCDGPQFDPVPDVTEPATETLDKPETPTD